MKVQTQSSGLLTNQSGYYDFYKKIDTNDFLKWLKDNYHIHTANCYYSVLLPKVCRYLFLDQDQEKNFLNSCLIKEVGYYSQ